MPDFEDDDLALFLGQVGQASHRQPLFGSFFGAALEPALGLKFPCQAAPQTAAVVEGAIAKGADAIMLRLQRWPWPLQQGEEGFLQHILGFAVA